MKKTRINITLSDTMIKKIDKMAAEIGTSRSALIGVWVGQTMLGIEKTYEAIDKVTKGD